jgi:hypothetical protein
MAESPKLQIVKRPVLCTTVVVLLFSTYLQVYFALWYGMGRGVVSRRVYRSTQRVESVHFVSVH